MKKIIYFLQFLFTRKINSNKTKNFAFFISVLTLLASCNSSNGRGSDSSQKNGLTVGKIEQPQPPNFLKADEICISGFAGNTINIHGVIKNTAPAASYKDAVVKVTYYSYTKKELGNKEYTINEIFPPHSDVRIELEVEKYKDVNTIGWEVIQASAN